MSKAMNRGSTASMGLPMRRFGVDALRYLVAQSAPALTGFLSAFVFTRVFSTEAYGMYSMILAVVAPATVLVAEWAAQPIGRFFSEFHVAGRMPLYKALLSRLLRIELATAFLAGASVVLYGGQAWGVLAALGAGTLLVLESLGHVVIPILPASLDSRSYRIVQVGRAVLKFGLSLFLVLTFQPSVESLLWGTVLGSLIMMVPLLYSVRYHLGPVGIATRQFRVAGETRMLRRQLRRFLGYGLPMMGWYFGSQLMSVGDRYVIQAFLGSSAVGLYSATYSVLSGMSGLLSAPVTFAAFPIIMRLWAEGHVTETQDTVSEMTAWYLVLGIWLIGGLALVGEDLLTVVLGPDFRPGWVIALPVVTGMVFWNASILGHKSLELNERTKLMAVLALIAAAFNVVANIIAVPVYGIEGAAWTTLLSYMLYSALIWAASRRTLVRWSIPWNGVAAILVAGGLGFMVADALVFSGIMGILLQGATFTAVFLGICFSYLRWNQKVRGALRWGRQHGGDFEYLSD